MVKYPLAITACEVLTPLEGRCAEHGLWEALRAGRRVERENAVREELLEGEEWLDRSVRIGLTVARRALAGAIEFQHREHRAHRVSQRLVGNKTSGQEDENLRDSNSKNFAREGEGMAGEAESGRDGMKVGDGTMKLFCGTSKGPVGVMLDLLARVRRGEAVMPEQARQVALGVGAMGTILGERLGLGAGVTSVAACSSGLHALHAAAAALWRGECERALVVAADASLYPLFEASFARLGVLAPRDGLGVRRCVPFGEEGKGFFLSEAGAAVVVERRRGEGERGRRGEGEARGRGDAGTQRRGEVVAVLEESWIGGDGTGLVAIDKRTETLRRGLAACVGDGVAFVQAHATGTAHDAYELEAIRAVCGEGVEVFSHKGWLGHSLGAAGLVSVALSALCHARGETVTGTRVEAGAASLTVAQGFGGHVGVVRLRGGTGAQGAL